MNWGLFGFLFIFALFILLMITNPRLSCFGKRIKSPLYPLFRKKKKRRKTDDYGFRLVEEMPEHQTAKMTAPRTHLSGKKKPVTARTEKKADDYGFKLVDDDDKEQHGREEQKGENK